MGGTNDVSVLSELDAPSPPGERLRTARNYGAGDDSITTTESGSLARLARDMTTAGGSLSAASSGTTPSPATLSPCATGSSLESRKHRSALNAKIKGRPSRRGNRERNDKRLAGTVTHATPGARPIQSNAGYTL